MNDEFFDKLAMNTWLQHLADQVRLGISLTPDENWKLAQALPGIMKKSMDEHVAQMVAESQTETARHQCDMLRREVDELRRELAALRKEASE